MPSGTPTGSRGSRLTQRLQLQYRLLPHGLDVDAGEAPLGGHLEQVRPPVAVGQHVAVEGRVLQEVLTVGKVPGPGGEPELVEGLRTWTSTWGVLLLSCSPSGVSGALSQVSEDMRVNGQMMWDQRSWYVYSL